MYIVVQPIQEMSKSKDKKKLHSLFSMEIQNHITALQTCSTLINVDKNTKELGMNNVSALSKRWFTQKYKS